MSATVVPSCCGDGLRLGLALRCDGVDDGEQRVLLLAPQRGAQPVDTLARLVDRRRGRDAASCAVGPGLLAAIVGRGGEVAHQAVDHALQIGQQRAAARIPGALAVENLEDRVGGEVFRRLAAGQHVARPVRQRRLRAFQVA